MLTARKFILKSFVRQHDQSDCGVACLLSIIKYYGGTNTFDNVRRLSGTNITGTTMLGLFQAAEKLGFDVEGCLTSIDLLSEYDKPSLLYVHSNHYVVCFGTITVNNELLFIIGDPATEIEYYTIQKLDEIWQTKKCLTLNPNSNFKKDWEVKNEKKKWVFNLLHNDFPILSIALAIGLAISILSLSTAIFSQRLIDNILPKKNFANLNLGIVLVFLLLLVKEGLSALRQLFLLRQSKDFNIRIIDFFYKQILQLNKPFFDTHKIGELTARLNDTSRIQRVITQLVGNAMIDGLAIIVSAIFIFKYSWIIGFTCIAITPIFFLIIYNYNKQIIFGQRNIMSSYASVEGNYISTIQGIEAIKNYNKQKQFSNSNNSIYKDFQTKTFSLGIIQIKLSFLANAFASSFMVCVLLFASYEVLKNHLKIGELMAILGMIGYLLPSVANLAMISIPINEAKIAFDRMFEFTAIKPEKDTHENDLIKFKSLRLQNLCFRFAGRSQLLKNFSFHVNKSEIIGILGENGCGKSTLTQILQKNYNYEAGQIVVNNNLQLAEISISSWRQIVGVVPQNIHIFNCTVLENIAFDDAQNKTQEVLTFLDEMCFTKLIDKLPQSFMTLVGEGGINLSGGQKQIIAIARALYNNPELLILDEATAAMDRETEQYILALLNRLKYKMGMIFITHRLHILKSICDRIYIIENGIISNSGNHDKLLESENLYSSYWNDLVS